MKVPNFYPQAILIISAVCCCQATVKPFIFSGFPSFGALRPCPSFKLDSMFGQNQGFGMSEYKIFGYSDSYSFNVSDNSYRIFRYSTATGWQKSKEKMQHHTRDTESNSMTSLYGRYFFSSDESYRPGSEHRQYEYHKYKPPHVKVAKFGRQF